MAPFLFLVSAKPWYIDLTLLGFFFIIFYRSQVYEKAKRLVIRMDLLPDKEALYLTRFGFFGNVFGECVGLDDLEKLEYEDLIDKGIS